MNINITAPDNTVPYGALFKKYAEQYGLDWRLLAAHASVESSFNPNSINPKDPSYGLGQILCKADEDGYCTNAFPAVTDFNEYTKDDLLDPETNISIMAQIVKSNVHAYGLPKAIAVYNEWGAHTAPANGPFPNQGYVDKVTRAWQRYQSAYPDL